VSAQRSIGISQQIHLNIKRLNIAKASCRMMIFIRIARILIVNSTIQRFAFGNLLPEYIQPGARIPVGGEAEIISLVWLQNGLQS